MNRLFAAALLATLATPAVAQDAPDKPPRRWRVVLGPEIVPRYPGADSYQLQPFVAASTTRGDRPFEFQAPDESFSTSLLSGDRFAIGPSLSFLSSRRARDVGVAVPNVGFTVEAGGFVQYQLAPAIRLRAEARKGIGGHRGVIGEVSADYVQRDGDRWLFSLGPRVTVVDDRFARAYFGVTPATATATGLRAFRPSGGLEAVGATAGVLRQLTPKWGLYGYAKYDRLVEDAARSPIVRDYGSRNQFSAGIALTYTFTTG